MDTETFSATKIRIKSVRFPEGICEFINVLFYFGVSYFYGLTFLIKFVFNGGN